ncbi:MAG: tRNA (adenosine(37)-N6)-threonylcarbamoyltransferase complex dimerization subunit type 1 TsaB [Rhodospirillaceae bacterium]
MMVLALETATAACSVALWDGRVRAARFLALGRGHAERLAPMIAEVLAEAGLTADAVDRLAVTVGPGAFTGLRIGLAAARGLALATGRPVVGLTTFETIGHGLPAAARAGRTLLVAVDSRRAELFLQRFDAGLVPLGEPAVLSPEAAARWLAPGPLLVAGDGAPLLRAALAARPETRFADGPGLPDAAVLARIAATLAAGAGRPPRPLYLRAPDAQPTHRPGGEAVVIGAGGE